MRAKLITEMDLDLSSLSDFFAVVYSVFDFSLQLQVCLHPKETITEHTRQTVKDQGAANCPQKVLFQLRNHI